MTAPTQGKERGQPRRPRSLPSRLLTLPSLPSWRRWLRAPASRAPWRARPSPPFPRGSPAAPDLLRSWHLTLPRSHSSARSAPCLPGLRGLAAGGTREPQASGRRGWEGGGRCVSRSHDPLLGRAGVWRPLSAAAARGCAPSSPGSTASPGAPVGLVGGAEPRPGGGERS